ncbi:hypothetical protein [Streptomyces vinaceus]|uniref:hypothetical protein n=1 Tax=Streptomyces vinaceus TaxID=1960 RepID=UPI0036A54052
MQRDGSHLRRTGTISPAKTESWLAIEGRAGTEPPDDHKRFVDEYGDAAAFRHLFVAHPDGAALLLKVMQEEHQAFFEGIEGVRHESSGEGSGLAGFLPWAYYDFNGDVCLLVPPADRNENRRVARPVRVVRCACRDWPRRR